MPTRRVLILSAAAVLLAAGLPRSTRAADDPAGVTAIYTRVTNGKGDTGGNFAVGNKAARAKYLSKSFAGLWAKAGARTRKGDGDPVGFDPITNSQDPDVKSFKVVAEKQDADKALIAVTVDSHHSERPNPADATIRYDFVRDAGQWKIDDIKGAVDGKPWSIRAILTDSLKY